MYAPRTHTPASHRPHAARGSMLALVLVFSFVFVILLTGATTFIVQQRSLQLNRVENARALQIAEAGLEYYKWFLAHYPNDVQNGTGAPGPYVMDYKDPEGGIIGKYSLDISGVSQCGQIEYVDITSTGWTLAEPGVTRTVYGRYSRPTVADYSYIINSNVWAGPDRKIYGPYHSNGGIRMDGTNYAEVTSAQTSWLCTPSFACNPSQNVDGVFGSGPNSSLWKFPSSNIDFEGITLDLVQIKSLAQSSGLYFPQISGASPRRGYHLVFQADGTVDVYRVTKSRRIWSYDGEDGWARRYEIITRENFLGSYTVPATCSVIFVEDKVWVEGVVEGKITVASADVINPVYTTDVILNGSLTYAHSDGTDGLVLLAQNNIRIPLLSPDNMKLNGIFIAQQGDFGRNYYTKTGQRDVPRVYDSYVFRNSLDIVGTIVSNGRVGTKWYCGDTEKYCSGYANRTNTYDAALADAPPPFTPTVSPDYRFVMWSEEN